MEKELAEKMLAAIQQEDDDAGIRPDYSGRGMFGETTHGIATILDQISVLEIVIMCADMFVTDEMEPAFGNISLRVDSMGLGLIIY